MTTIRVIFFSFYPMGTFLFPMCWLSVSHHGKSAHSTLPLDSREVSTSPSLLRAEQTHLPQPLLTHPVLQPRPFWWPLLDSQDLHWEPQTGLSTAGGISPVQNRARIPSLTVLAALLLGGLWGDMVLIHAHHQQPQKHFFPKLPTVFSCIGLFPPRSGFYFCLC